MRLHTPCPGHFDRLTRVLDSRHPNGIDVLIHLDSRALSALVGRLAARDWSATATWHARQERDTADCQ